MSYLDGKIMTVKEFLDREEYRRCNSIILEHVGELGIMPKITVEELRDEKYSKLKGRFTDYDDDDGEDDDGRPIILHYLWFCVLVPTDIKLSIQEANLVDKITERAKMDWLWLETDSQGDTKAYDLEENHKEMPIYKAVLTVDDGVDLEPLGLSIEETEEWKALVDRAKVKLEQLRKEGLE